MAGGRGYTTFVRVRGIDERPFRYRRCADREARRWNRSIPNTVHKRFLT